ncbi:hypothetical protein Tco_0191125 [Tanacetum coccineum]
MTPELFANFLNLSSPDSVPLAAIIVIAEPIFAYDHLQRSCLITGVTSIVSHRVSSQKVDKFEVSNRGLKRILERSIGEKPYLLGIASDCEGTPVIVIIKVVSHPQLLLGIRYPNLID